MTNTYDIDNSANYHASVDIMHDYLHPYHDMRMRAMAARFEDGQHKRLERVQESTGEWIERVFLDQEIDYGTYDKSTVESKMYALADYLVVHHSDDITNEEIEATRLFIESTFGVYEEVMSDTSDASNVRSILSYAFLVPGRASRKNQDYGAESELIIPILRYVPNKYRSLFIHGVPPFILDFYEEDDDGDRGAVVCALVSPEDMFPEKADYVDETEYTTAFMTAGWQAIQGVNNATEFARRLGADVAGFGAVLPRITDYGARIDNKGIFTTTGHAGTIVLIFQTINVAIEQGIIDEHAPRHLAIAGLGKIGASIARLAPSYYPDAKITLYDSREPLTLTIAEEMAQDGANVHIAQSMEELLSSSSVAISAITSQLTQEEIAASKEGLLIIDDSQPACIDPDIASRYGATVAWVVGMHESGTRRIQWGYGTFADEHNDLFGCEIETSILSRYRKDLAGKGYSKEEIDTKTREIALTGPVTPEKVIVWRQLFQEYDIKPARLQSFGKYVIT
ncbi:hypothetical protein KC871_00710 [Candidatus Saccharibacteria bacterium]|nr:hypothetical protein [Candidatus Saccharibacteria bacterium]MCB9817564.1 hypothetical protein [Candidatus Nomurabacteria bacterium]HPD99240.1 hypothetical protein [Candidatus Saccharibacteria bacterium]